MYTEKLILAILRNINAYIVCMAILSIYKLEWSPPFIRETPIPNCLFYSINEFYMIIFHQPVALK